MTLYYGCTYYKPPQSNKGIPLDFFYDPKSKSSLVQVIGTTDHDENIARFVQEVVEKDPSKFREVDFSSKRFTKLLKKKDHHELYLSLMSQHIL